MTETIWHSLYGVSNYHSAREKRFVESIDILGFTCLDLGFNYGWWSWLFLKNIGKEGRVYAWEPNNFLFENYLAKWPFKNLTGYSYALSDKNGEQNFYIHGEKGEKSGLNSLEDVKDSASPIIVDPPIEIRKIKTKTLDSWWNENGSPEIDFVKIDCEGHDYKILQGGKKMFEITRPKYIIIEQKNEDVTKFLKGLEYTDQHEHNEFGLADSIWKYDIQSKKGGN